MINNIQPKSRDQLATAFKECMAIIERDGHVNLSYADETIKVTPCSLRSLDQNDMKERQVHEIAVQLYGGDEDHARREAKYQIGCRILMRDDQKYREFFQAISHLTHEQKLKAMDLIPVTSVMNKTQMTEYIERVFQYYAEKGVAWPAR